MKHASAFLFSARLSAALLFSACATLNDPKASAPSAGSPPFNLAVLFPDERNFPADPLKAVDWIKKQAATNDAQAEFALGWVYYLGAGLPKDATQATQLFEKAAAIGYEEAMLSLAFLQDDTPRINGETNIAPRPDPHGYEQAAAKGNEIAAEILREENNSLSAPPSAKLLQWQRKLANLGVPAAQVLQGRYNLSGYGGLPKSPQQAITWFLLADAQGSGAADASLGMLYAQGTEGLPQDLAQAVLWLNKGANRGAPLALSYLGELTANGNGVLKNEVEGLAMMYAAQAQGTVFDAAAIGEVEKHLDALGLAVAIKRRDEILGPDKVRALQSPP